MEFVAIGALLSLLVGASFVGGSESGSDDVSDDANAEDPGEPPETADGSSAEFIEISELMTQAEDLAGSGAGQSVEFSQRVLSAADFPDDEDSFDDDLYVGSATADSMQGSDADEIFVGNDDDDIIVGGLGDDAMSGDGGSDILFGQGGDDTLNGAGDISQQIEWMVRGGEGLPVGLAPGSMSTQNLATFFAATQMDQGTVLEYQQDLMSGGAGDDDLIMGPGDVAMGGDGSDVFYLNAVDLTDRAVEEPTDYLQDMAEQTLITDYTPGDDMIAVFHSSGLTGLVGDFPEDAQDIALTHVSEHEVRLSDGLGNHIATVRSDADLSGMTADDIVIVGMANAGL